MMQILTALRNEARLGSCLPLISDRFGFGIDIWPQEANPLTINIRVGA